MKNFIIKKQSYINILQQYLFGLLIFTILYCLLRLLMDMIYYIFIYNENFQFKTEINNSYNQLIFFYRYTLISCVSILTLILVLPFFKKEKIIWFICSVSNVFLAITPPIKHMHSYLKINIVDSNSRLINGLLILVNLVMVFFIIRFFFKSYNSK